MAKRTNRTKNSASSKTTIKNEKYSTDSENVIWRFDKIDRSGHFAFDLKRDDFLHKEVMEKLLEYSTMTWKDIKQQTHDDGKSKNHLLAIETLSPKAFERFKAKHFEEYSDLIFSFALQNKLRIIGIRINAYFHVVWYDPKHEFCPSTKKHT